MDAVTSILQMSLLNMYVQCDAEGNQYNLMESVIDHKTDGHAVDRDDMYIKHGINKQVMNTTKGWHRCIEWKDGTTSWELQVDLKESSTVKVAEYAVSKNLRDAPAFFLWVLHVLKKRSRIIADVTRRYHKQTHKFLIEVPKS
jgi:SH3-like domain-containing protein